MRTEFWMRNRKTSHLEPNQKSNRSKVLGLLREYWKKGEFPINTTHKKKIPQIKDQNGTLCALAYILQNLGKQQLVKEIAQQNNYVYVDDVPDKHPLNYAIKENGFTKKEAAEIQPFYCNCELLANQSLIFGSASSFISAIIAIAGLAMSVVVYRFSARNFQRFAIIFGIIGISIGGAWFAMEAPDSYLRMFDYPGTMGTYSIDEEHVVLYWVLNGKVTDLEYTFHSVNLNLEATSNGEITVVLPGKKCGVDDKIFPQASSIIVLIDREEIPVSPTIEKKQFVVTMPFEEGKRLIEILGPDPVC